MKSNKNNFQYIKTKSLKMKEKVKKLLSYSSKFYVKYINIMIKIDVQFKNKTYDDIKNIYRKTNRENTYMIDQYLRIKQL